jgi:hypothetical protein
MKIFDLFDKIFGSNNENEKAISELNEKIKQHPVLKNQIEEIDNVLSSYTIDKSESNENFGLTICATEGAGKTFFIIEFLLDYFYATKTIDSKKVLKLTGYQLVQQSAPFQKILTIKDEPQKLEQKLLDNAKGCIVMVDDLHTKDSNFSTTQDAIANLIKNSDYNNTIFIYCSGYHKLKNVKRDWKIGSYFPEKYQMDFPSPNSNQLCKLFEKYAELRGYSVDEESFPTLKYFFETKMQVSRMSNDLFYQRKLDRKKRERFVYARELQGLLKSIELVDHECINKYDIQSSGAFQDNKKLYDELKALY